MKVTTKKNNDDEVRMIEVNDQEEQRVYSINSAIEKVLCLVGGTQLEIIIDSGSKYNLIDDSSWKIMRENGLIMKNQRKNAVRFKAYGSHPRNVVTVFDADIEVRDVQKTLKDFATFYVIESGQEPLLGKETAQKMGLLIIGLPGLQKQQQVYSITSQPNPFAKIKGVKIKLQTTTTSIYSVNA